MQFEVENHFYSMMERLCIYVDNTRDHVIEELDRKITSDNIIASDILNIAVSTTTVNERIQECRQHIQTHFKELSERSVCSIIRDILELAYEIQKRI